MYNINYHKVQYLPYLKNIESSKNFWSNILKLKFKKTETIKEQNVNM